MIRLYSGTPGSGKSYHVAIDIYRWLKLGKNVIANFDINTDCIKNRNSISFCYIDNFDLSVSFLLEYCRDKHVLNSKGYIKEAQTLLVIDECQLLFNSRSWNDRKRLEWATFFTQHRKYGYEIILVSQFDRLIDRQIRSLIEYEHKHRKVNNFGFFGGLISLFLLGKPLFVSVEIWYGLHEKCSSTFMIGLNKYYNLYNSYKIFDSQSS